MKFILNTFVLLIFNSFAQFGKTPARNDEHSQDADLRKFFEQFHQALFEYIYFRCNKKIADAEDILQQTFLELKKYISKKRVKLTYQLALQIAKNNIIDFLRRRRKSKDYVFADFASEAESKILFESLTYTEIEKSTYIPELVGKALSALTPMHKKLLLMKYEQELSLSEIARNLGRSPDSVKSAIKRARAAFRRAFTATKKFYEKEQ